MFTGIVEAQGRLTEREGAATARQARLRVAHPWRDLVLGESVSVNGVCLSVAELPPGGDAAVFFASHETLARTNLGAIAIGAAVNLERALPANGRLSGHLVQGHVDGVARWISAEPILEEAAAGEETDGSPTGAWRVACRLPVELARYCVEKGSIALDGVSLTINRVIDEPQGTRVEIALIPLTWAGTGFAALAPGDPVNVEVDVLAKYVERMLGARAPEARP